LGMVDATTPAEGPAGAEQTALSAVLAAAAAGRLAWRCRRGMKELDLLLAGWLRDRYPAASQTERAAFAAFLELPDPVLARYLLGGESPADRAAQRIVAGIAGAGAMRYPP